MFIFIKNTILIILKNKVLRVSEKSINFMSTDPTRGGKLVNDE